MYIKIGAPYLERNETKVKLCAKIQIAETEKVMYFEVDKIYASALCYQNADAFVVGLAYFASVNGYDIRSDVPINAQLLYQLTTYYFPTLAKTHLLMKHDVQIDAPTYFQQENSASGVATAASGGVDSFYSILRHYKDSQKDERYQVTHLVVANLFNRYEDEQTTRERFDVLCGSSQCIANALDLPMISIYTNHHEFMYQDFVSLYSLRLCSYAFALQNLLGVYLVSAFKIFQDTLFEGKDASEYDLFNMPMMSTNRITFYSSGGEINRPERTAYISEYQAARRFLHVCNYSDASNCSACDKCMRTMLGLDILGCLSKYENVFSLEEYAKKRNAFLAKSIAYSSDISYGPFYLELLELAKQHDYQIPIHCYFKAFLLLRPLGAAKKLLKKSKCIKHFYFKFKIDYLVYGKEKAEIFRYGRTDIGDCD